VIHEDQLEGQICTADRQLLWDIRAELRLIREHLMRKPEAGVPPRTDTLPPVLPEKVYTCKYCDEAFQDRYKMANHVSRCPKRPKRGEK